MINNEFIRNIFQSVVDKIGLEQTIINFVIVLGIILIYTYVIYNFINAKKRKSKKKKEVKSVVETTSMSTFFIIIALVVNLEYGTYHHDSTVLNIIFLVIYIICIVINLLGRYYLGDNWGNNVIIYTDQTLVTYGVYRIVRHPLYASIIWAIYAIGVLRRNYVVFLLNTFIFIPFMYYRAKQEEKELIQAFEDYKNYQKKTGMFFPNIYKMIKKEK